VPGVAGAVVLNVPDVAPLVYFQLPKLVLGFPTRYKPTQSAPELPAGAVHVVEMAAPGCTDEEELESVYGDTGTGVTLIERLAVATRDALSCNLTEKLKRPSCDGVPAMTPAAFKVRPGGRAPLVILHEKGVVPPLVCTVWE
jgi:hypothetical protein